MLDFLNRPYPFNDDLRYNAKVILFISLGILAFLLFFQPIEIIDFSKKDVFYLVAGLTLTTFLTLTINLIILPSLFPKFFHKNWNIKREIIWNIWMLLAISSSYLLIYSKLFGLIDIHFSDIGKIILMGFLPVSVLIIINQDRLLRSNLKSAQLLNQKLIEKKEQQNRLISFESDYKNDEITIKPNSLYLIKSADNYIEIYYQTDEGIKKHLLRSTLKKAETTILEFDFFVRCHRSYIINTNYIKEIQGNSQGYKITIENIDFPILVSSKYFSDFKKMIK